MAWEILAGGGDCISVPPCRVTMLAVRSPASDTPGSMDKKTFSAKAKSRIAPTNVVKRKTKRRCQAERRDAGTIYRFPTCWAGSILIVLIYLHISTHLGRK